MIINERIVQNCFCLIYPTEVFAAVSIVMLLIIVQFYIWRSGRENQERHIKSPKYRELLEIIEQSMGTPEINFLTVSKIEGLEVVKKVRLKR